MTESWNPLPTARYFIAPEGSGKSTVAPLIAAFEEAVYHEITMSGVCGQSVMEDVEVAVYALRVALGLEVPSRIVGGQDHVTGV